MAQASGGSWLTGGSWLISMLAHIACRATSAAGLICVLLCGALAAPQTRAPETKAPETRAPETRAPGDVPVARDVRLAGDEAKTRVIVDLDRKIEVRAFALANPYRVIVDMPQVTFTFPDKTGEKGRGLVKAFRYGLVMQGGSRIVIDLVKPARIERAQVLDPANEQPARLVLDLAATDRDTFMRTIALNNRPPDRGPRPREPEPEAKIFVPRPLVRFTLCPYRLDFGSDSAARVSP